MMTAEPVAQHDPVMLEEVLEALRLRPGMFAVDGTLGLGGHAQRICAAIQPGGLFLGLDWDQGMIEIARPKLPADAVLVHTDYRSLAERVRSVGMLHGRTQGADAILLDLGLNSFQIEDAERGISFLKSGPLDMRMDRSKGEPAAALLNRISENELERILREFGGERWSRRIAKMVLEHRKKSPLRETKDLVDCVLAAIPAAMRETRIHPATRTFQAIRCAVNGELDDLEAAVRSAALSLAPGGTLVVLSYHSGEDRPTKVAFRDLAHHGFEEVTKKPLVPSEEEVARNKRSRSAKMRVLRRNQEGKQS